MSQGYTKSIPLDSDGTLALNSDFLAPTQKAVKTYVDTGLATKQATLTGNEAVLIPNRLLFKQNASIQHTGTLTQTIIFSTLVTAGNFQANDFIVFLAGVSATDNANTKTFQFYYNTSNSLTGAQLLATKTLTSGTARHTPIKRTFVFKNSLTALQVVEPTLSFSNDETFDANSSLPSRTINCALDVYFIMTCTLTNIADVALIRHIKTELHR